MLFYEDKELILSWLLQTLRCTKEGIALVNIAYKQLEGDREEAILVYENGYRKSVNITGDTGYQIIRDILKSIQEVK
jgi:hypothetical protein